MEKPLPLFHVGKLEASDVGDDPKFSSSSFSTAHLTGHPTFQEVAQTCQFELNPENADDDVIHRLLQNFDCLSKEDFSVKVLWKGFHPSCSHDHALLRILDKLKDLELLTELRILSFQSTSALCRLASYIRNNPQLESISLGFYLEFWPGVEKASETIGETLAANTSLRDIQLLPFSTSTSTTGHGQAQDLQPCMESILDGVRRNRSLRSLHLWAPGIASAGQVGEALMDHPTISELFLDGETTPWYRGKGVEQYHEFQYLVWKMICSPSCRLIKLKLRNFHLNTRTVDVLLSSLWKGHPLQVLDVSGNFLNSLHFPKYMEQNPGDESHVHRLRLLVVEDQCVTFASLEYDLTYHHDQSRCRQHCRDILGLIQAKPGLALHHSKIPAMISSTQLYLPQDDDVSMDGGDDLYKENGQQMTTEMLQYQLDHHRIVPPPIRKVDENFCLALWPRILSRSSKLLTGSRWSARQASIIFSVLRDWHTDIGGQWRPGTNATLMGDCCSILRLER